MSLPPIERLREIAMEVTLEVNEEFPDDEEAEKAAWAERVNAALIAEGYEPTEEELRKAGPGILRLIAADERKMRAKREFSRLFEEWKPYAEQWDEWERQVEEAEEDGVARVTFVEDHAFIGETVLVTLDELERMSGMFIALLDRIMRVVEPYPEWHPTNNDQVRFIRGLHAACVRRRTEWNRQVRLMEKRIATYQPPPEPPEVRRCAAPGCGKPAQANEFCKRHGREAGLVPQGKVEIKLSKREQRRLEREENGDE